MSNRDAAVAINSIAQHASPIGIGQSEFLRTQLKAASSRVKMTLPSILESYALEWLSGMAKVSSATYACKTDKSQAPGSREIPNSNDPKTAGKSGLVIGASLGFGT